MGEVGDASENKGLDSDEGIVEGEWWDNETTGRGWRWKTRINSCIVKKLKIIVRQRVRKTKLNKNNMARDYSLTKRS